MTISSVNSVSLLVAGTADGDVALLQGYYSPGDGGAGNLRWNATSTATADGGTIFAISGVPTGRWFRIFDGSINVKWFGATGNGTTDDSAAIIAMIAYIDTVAAEDMYFPAGNYLISNTVNLNNSSSKFTYRFLGASNNSTVLLLNTVPAAPTSDYYGVVVNASSYPIGVHPRVIFENFYVKPYSENLNPAYQSFLQLEGVSDGGPSIICRQVFWQDVKNGVITSGYCDISNFDNCSYYNGQVNGYMYYQASNGDSTLFQNCFFGSGGGTPNYNGVYINYAITANLIACIGGCHSFVNCQAVLIQGCHVETITNGSAPFYIQNSSVTFKSNYIAWVTPPSTPLLGLIVVDETGAEWNPSSSLTLEDNRFGWYLDASTSYTSSFQRVPELYFNNPSTRTHVQLNNNSCIFMLDGRQIYTYLGIQAASNDANLGPLLAGPSQVLLSTDAQLKYDTATGWRIQPGESQRNLLTTSAATTTIYVAPLSQASSYNSSLPADTYTYQIQASDFLGNPVAPSGTFSITTTAANQSVDIEVSPQWVTPVMLTIWRTAASSGAVVYAQVVTAETYVDLWDTGALISGQTWISTSTAPATAVSSYDGYWLNGHRIVYGSAAPTNGSWSQGDLVLNVAPTEGTALGWVCVTAGTPGVWTSYAGINYVNSVSALNAGASDGDVVMLMGYYAPGDGGSGLLRWSASSTATANAGTIFAITGVGTGRWLRIFDDGLNARWFGATGNGTSNDASAIQAMISCAESTNLEMYFPAGTYLLGSRLYLNSTTFDFTYRFLGSSGMTTQLIVSHSIGSDYVFYVNTSSGGSAVAAVGNNPRVVMENMMVTVDSQAGQSFMKLTGQSATGPSIVFRQVNIEQVLNGVYSSGFCNLLSLQNCAGTNLQAGGYLLHQSGNGNGATLVQNCSFNGGSVNANGVYLYQISGAKMEACFGGSHTFVSCLDVLVESCHIETSAVGGAPFYIENSQVVFKSNYIAWNVPPTTAINGLIWVDESSPVSGIWQPFSTLTLEDNRFAWFLNATSSYTSGFQRVPELYFGTISTKMQVVLNNNTCLYWMSGRQIYTSLGIQAVSSDTSLGPVLAGSTQVLLSGDAQIKYDQRTGWRIQPGESQRNLLTTIASINAIYVPTPSQSSGFNSTLPADTYTYEVQFYDFLGNAVATASSASITTAVANQAVDVEAYPEWATPIMLTVWRTASSTGAVVSASLPIVNTYVDLWDVGAIVSGQPWVSVGTVSPATVVSTYDGYWLNGHRIVYGAAAPTNGTWSEGDIMYNKSATAGGYIGWVCVTAGTPGTWKTFGAIST